jgi:hypothetical protein
LGSALKADLSNLTIKKQPSGAAFFVSLVLPPYAFGETRSGLIFFNNVNFIWTGLEV